MKKIFLFLSIYSILTSPYSFAQTKKLDSLWAVYNNKTQTDTNRLKAIHAIAWSHIKNNPDTTIILAGHELQLAQATKQKKYEGKALNTIGVSFYNKGNYPKTLEYYLLRV